MELTKVEQKIKEDVESELESEMAWLRNINTDDEKDVKRHALELIMSRTNSVRRKTIRELFGVG